MIGRFVRERPQLAREVAIRGHLVGNHTQTHPNLFGSLHAPFETNFNNVKPLCKMPSELLRKFFVRLSVSATVGRQYPRVIWACKPACGQRFPAIGAKNRRSG